MGMGLAIQMLEKSFSNGRNGRNYLQFNMVRQLRSAASDIYSATAASRSSLYSLKSHCGSVLHMYEGEMQSLLMERLSKGMKKRMPEDSDQNKPLNSLVVNYISNDIEHESFGSYTDQ